MTQEEFNDFITKNKVINITPNEFGGHILYFDNEDTINVICGIDEIKYEHNLIYNKIPNGSFDLVEELNKVSKKYIEKYIERYGNF